MISPEVFRRYPFFGFMNDAQLKGVAMVAEEVVFRPGETILEAGQPAKDLYFLLEGNAEYYYLVTTEHDPDYRQEYYISDFDPGDIFGISALIEPYVYTSTVRAGKKGCRAIRLEASALRALCEVDHDLSCGLLRAVAEAAMERLQSTRAQLIAAKP